MAFILKPLHIGISTFGWEGESILAFDASLEKKAWSWSWDSSLKRKPSLLALGCVRCRKECWLPLSPPWTFGSWWQKSLIGLSQAQFYQFNYTLFDLLFYKTRPKQWAKLIVILLLFDTLLQIFTSSLANVKSVRSPCGFGPSWMKPNLIFFSMSLVIGPLGGLWDWNSCGPWIEHWAWFRLRRWLKL